MTHTEYETAVRMPITRYIFDMLYTQFYKCNSKKLLIAYFNYTTLFNPGNVHINRRYRIVDDVFQYKHCLHRLNLLKIFVEKNVNAINEINTSSTSRKHSNIMFIPYTRTTAKEIIAEMSRRFNTIKNIIIRFIIYQKSTIRVCIEKVLDGNHGGSYYFSAEIEYHIDYSGMGYDQLTKKEDLYWNILSTIYFSTFYHHLDLNSIYNYVELTQLLHIPCRKFSSFYEYSCNMSDYKLKYKFDGYKGRMIHNNVKSNTVLYWDDMHNAGEIKSSFLNSFPHIVFQYELLPKKRWVILTDIAGVIFHKQLYMPEPSDVLSFFDCFPRENFDSPLLAKISPSRWISFTSRYHDQCVNKAKDTFIIGVQFAIVDDNLNQLLIPTFSETDGFIVVCNNREYKYKIPTLDVRIRNEFAYLDQIPDPLFDRKLLSTFLLSPHSIYEITFKKGQIIVLRERFERQFTSNLDEFSNFKKELDFMSQQLHILNTQEMR